MDPNMKFQKAVSSPALLLMKTSTTVQPTKQCNRILSKELAAEQKTHFISFPDVLARCTHFYFWHWLEKLSRSVIHNWDRFSDCLSAVFADLCILVLHRAAQFPAPSWSEVHRVRLSRKSCMINVESLYESSATLSSSAMASSKAVRAILHASSGSFSTSYMKTE